MQIKVLLKTKNLDTILEEAEKPEYRLRRALGPFQLTLLGIGAIIGAGIFATIGTAAAGDAFRPGAGPALVLSFFITAVICGFTALCYAEFASMVPVSGSAYTYSYATLGEFVAWIIGWDLIIEYAVGNIAVAISWANYFKTFVRGFGVFIPDWMSMDYRSAARVVDAAGVQTVFRDAPHVFGFPVVFNLPAAAVVALITIVLVWGIRESSRFNAAMVTVKLLVLGFFVTVGAMHVRPENWVPFAPNGWGGISAGAAIVFFAYIGFDAVSTTAEETRNPKRDMPIGIIASLIVCTIIYIVVSAVFTGLIGYPDLRAKLASQQAEPLTMALEHVKANLGWAVGIVAFGSIIAHMAVLLVFQLGQPRILFSMSRDGLLPHVFSRVHPRFRTPHVSTILTGVFVAAFASVASIDEMVDLTNIGTLFAFILVGAGIIVLRIKDPARPRPFRVPGGWLWAGILYVCFAAGIFFLKIPILWKGLVVLAGAVFFALLRNHIFPALGIMTCLYLIYYLPPTSWLRFAAWLNVGFVVYVGYGSVHSRLTGTGAEAGPEGRHDASTAAVGSWLALAGTLLLFIMRGFDLFLLAAKTSAKGAALSSLLHAGAWLEPSLFLVVPLFLNAFVLCPVVVRRALKARGGGARSHVTTIALATAVALVTVAYLALVVIRIT
jgi:APA family basic amino acid/polyamine antiporter